MIIHKCQYWLSETSYKNTLKKTKKNFNPICRHLLRDRYLARVRQRKYVEGMLNDAQKQQGAVTERKRTSPSAL